MSVTKENVLRNKSVIGCATTGAHPFTNTYYQLPKLEAVI